ncbi:MAG TPA: helix-turn-helix transcriptional regulator, partial [Burkholderiales bacterium]|nr:helix-turn-helix transcriptional regulator [Burkholderiales bacterium]
LLMTCAAVPAAFWFFAQALFTDGFRLRAWHAIPVAALLIAALLDLYLALSSGPVSSIARLASAVTAKLLALAFIVSALVQVSIGRTSDLLESRRTMRGVVVATVGAYMVVVVAVELYLRGAEAPPPLSVLDASITIVLALAVSAAIWRIRDPALGNVPQPSDRVLDPIDRAIVERLTRAMEVEHLYRREGLTITSLADALQLQEHRLRHVINQHLGFRNFNDFLNQRRIRDACEALSDPARSRIPVLTIALDLGYRSLSPFNRAFKEYTSLTPSQYRRAKLSAPPPADSAEPC